MPLHDVPKANTDDLADAEACTGQMMLSQTEFSIGQASFGFCKLEIIQKPLQSSLRKKWLSVSEVGHWDQK